MQRTITLRDGAAVDIRPIEPEDADLLVAGFERLSPSTRYARFLTAVPSLPRHWVAGLVELDHRDREALVALDSQSGDMVGVARYVRLQEDPQTADFAIVIGDPWQGRGLGRILLGELVEAARANGIERFSGDVFAENQRMLGLGRTIGRSAHVGVPDSGVSKLVIEL